jgi:hypothetical protein
MHRLTKRIACAAAVLALGTFPVARADDAVSKARTAAAEMN